MLGGPRTLEQIRRAWTLAYPLLLEGRGSNLQPEVYALIANFLINLPENARIADIGGGTGHHIKEVKKLLRKNFEVFVNDIARQRLADERYVSVIKPAEDLTLRDFGNRELDAIFCAFTLEYMENQREALKRIWALLKPGGLAIFLFHDKNSNAIFTIVKAAEIARKHYEYYEAAVKFLKEEIDEVTYLGIKSAYEKASDAKPEDLTLIKGRGPRRKKLLAYEKLVANKKGIVESFELVAQSHERAFSSIQEAISFVESGHFLVKTSAFRRRTLEKVDPRVGDTAYYLICAQKE